MTTIPRAAALAAALAVVPATAAVTPTTLSGPGSQPASWSIPAGDAVAWTTASGETWGATATDGVWSPASAIAPTALFGLAAGGGSTLALTVDVVTGGFAPEVREAGAGGAWTPVPGLEGRSARGGAAVAVNARGEGLVAWATLADPSGRYRVFVAWRRPGGAWSAPKQLGRKFRMGEGETGLRAALDDAGRGTVTWTSRGRITAAVGVVFGKWAAPRTYGTGSATVVAAGSRTVVAWVEGRQRVIRIATMGAFRLSPPRTVLVAPAGIAIADVYPAVGPDGTAVVAYTPQRIRPGTGTTVRRAAITRSPAGAWSRPVTLSPPAPAVRGIPWTTASVARDGTLAVAWRQADHIEARTRRIGGAWAPVTVPGTVTGSAIPTAAPSPAAGARLTWVDSARVVRVVDLPVP